MPPPAPAGSRRTVLFQDQPPPTSFFASREPDVQDSMDGWRGWRPGEEGRDGSPHQLAQPPQRPPSQRYSQQLVPQAPTPPAAEPPALVGMGPGGAAAAVEACVVKARGEGIGLSITDDTAAPVLLAVRPGSPGARAGLDRYTGWRMDRVDEEAVGCADDFERLTRGVSRMTIRMQPPGDMSPQGPPTSEVPPPDAQPWNRRPSTGPPAGEGVYPPPPPHQRPPPELQRLYPPPPSALAPEPQQQLQQLRQACAGAASNGAEEAAPASLLVTTTEPGLDGLYPLLQEAHRGRPMWGGADRRLYAGMHGGWMIGGSGDCHETNVGWLKADSELLPHLVPPGSWERYDAEREVWLPDGSTNAVAAGPPSGGLPHRWSGSTAGPAQGQQWSPAPAPAAGWGDRLDGPPEQYPVAFPRSASPARDSYAPWANSDSGGGHPAGDIAALYQLRRRLEFCLRTGDAEGVSDAVARLDAAGAGDLVGAVLASAFRKADRQILLRDRNHYLQSLLDTSAYRGRAWQTRPDTQSACVSRMSV